jgi:aryl-alcohol dehydrogenase-like predicted oxidoreductase
MFNRKLGKSGITASALGLGCWAIGGPASRNGKPTGWGRVDDGESTRGIHCAIDLGVTLFDTADSYGDGHSEEVLGRAVAGKRERVLLATKFGAYILRQTPPDQPVIADEAKIRRCCEDSLARLKTDYIDLYQFHLGDYDPERSRIFSQGRHCTAIQQRLNVMEGDLATLKFCQQLNLANLNRTPLGRGLLTAKFTPHSRMPADDIRSQWWDFSSTRMEKKLKAIGRLKNVLSADGRTPAQGAWGWLWAKSDVTIPIPGFKTVKQVEENVKAADYGPLSAEQMEQVEKVKQTITDWD